MSSVWGKVEIRGTLGTVLDDADLAGQRVLTIRIAPANLVNLQTAQRLAPFGLEVLSSDLVQVPACECVFSKRGADGGQEAASMCAQITKLQTELNRRNKLSICAF